MKRNILEESARITHGNIKSLQDFRIEDYEALILPGVYGALKNFTNFPAENGIWEVKPEIAKLILSFYEAKKPIGAICIFPSILAILFKDKRIRVTTGLNPESKKLISFTKAEIVLVDSDEIVQDENSLIISTPAFMNDTSLSKVYSGINKLIKQIQRMVK
jgi:enhancing lycopene biosynthesis protein 2